MKESPNETPQADGTKQPKFSDMETQRIQNEARAQLMGGHGHSHAPQPNVSATTPYGHALLIDMTRNQNPPNSEGTSTAGSTTASLANVEVKSADAKAKEETPGRELPEDRAKDARAKETTEAEFEKFRVQRDARALRSGGTRRRRPGSGTYPATQSM